MAILNVTPDSFSDGGEFLNVETAIARALQLVGEGADILDVGGESTRPNAAPVTEAEELRRVLPVIERLAATIAVPISIDTMKPGVARAALRAGASIVNDVAANRTNPEMWHAAAEAGAGYVAMHMRGTPQTMQHEPVYRDVAAEVNDFFGERLLRMSAEGLAPEQVALDPGLGFGKTLEHNLQLLGALRSFTKWKRPLLLGASRKSFLRTFADGTTAGGRLPASLACACWAVAHGVNIIRTHDPDATRQALRMTEALVAHVPGSETIHV
ncbi:MAG: dihydropteroate synthase [Verrucomicrobiota bacterium]|jgi:dihydropteroate synthase